MINLDKDAAYPKCIAEIKANGVLLAPVELQQVKYLNNLIEQAHRFIKRLVKPGMDFFSSETAQRTILKDANLERAMLSNTNFTGANLSGALQLHFFGERLLYDEFGENIVQLVSESWRE